MKNSGRLRRSAFLASGLASLGCAADLLRAEPASAAPPAIAGVPTSVAAFVGSAERGPVDTATRVASFAAFEATFGSAAAPLGTAARAFFENGGTSLYVVRTRTASSIGDPAAKTGIFALEAAPALGVLAAPRDPAADSRFATSAARKAFDLALARYAATRRAMAIFEAPPEWTPLVRRSALAAIQPSNDLFGVTAAAIDDVAPNCAVYFGRIADTGRAGRFDSPLGAIAGLWARNDSSRGVWKAPAGVAATLLGTPGLDLDVDDSVSAALTALRVNPLRSFAGTAGPVVWGARTLSSDSQWQYVNVRRLVLYVESSVQAGLQWTTFEANGPPLWAEIVRSISAFLNRLFVAGALLGSTASQAYFVRCDRTTMTQTDIANGTLVALVGVAPVYPAEFIVFQIGSWAGASVVPPATPAPRRRRPTR